MNLNDTSICSAHAVDERHLLEFYRTVYPERAELLSAGWKWLYRSSSVENRAPLVAHLDGRLIAHAGMIPFTLSALGVHRRAAWFIDFAILPEYQRMGLGTRLTEEWMSLSEVSVTFCNDKSMGIFRRFGWAESFGTYFHRYILSPFDHPRLRTTLPDGVRNICRPLASPLFAAIYRRFAPSVHTPVLQEVDQSVLENWAAAGSGTAIHPARDRAYWAWRIMDSPHRDRYRTFTTRRSDATGLLVKLYADAEPKSIDILWASDSSDFATIRHLISALACWGIDNGYASIRQYTSNALLSGFLSRCLRPVVLHPRFAFHTSDQNLLQAGGQRSRWDIQLIDSDFEILSP